MKYIFYEYIVPIIAGAAGAAIGTLIIRAIMR
jgi:hypothetical protein